MYQHLRIARPVTDLASSVSMYRQGLGWHVLGEFADHEGFDGAMLGDPQANCHVEFTVRRAGHVVPSPTPEDLIVLYLPVQEEWLEACRSMASAGFSEVAPFNPYWVARGKTFQDPDGYRVVLQNASWPHSPH
ncbi:MAG: VOC family protein [Comamonadaceae bacterium]|nr:MAG: VOC family protein [Comamonadaceae bacterium]